MAGIETSNQLHVLSDVSRSLATFTDLDQLVHYATGRIRELFGAQGCALLLLDGERREFYFPVAGQRESGVPSEADLAEVRFPADQGVAGWVLARDEATAVADTASDPRFYAGVDRRTAMQTRSLLCAPLRTRSGNIGVIEVVNPGPDRLGAADLEFLDILASVIGVAYEKAALYRELEQEALDLRRFLRLTGGALIGLALVVVAAATFYHRARVLPWSELPGQRGVLFAVLCLAVGVLLAAAGKGRIVSGRARR